MEKEKYYTPTIEELNVNQEVYLLDTGNYKASYSEGDIYPMIVTITQLTDYPTIWVKTKGTDNYNKIYEVYLDQIGLKYLDREDIESFGWEYKEGVSSSDNEVFSLSKSNGGFNDTTIYKLSKIGNILSIKFKIETSWGGGEGQCFYGTIKNKTEFSRLLKQLSII